MNMRRLLAIALVSAAAPVLFTANRAEAQATTVQLPTFHYFSVNTTVLVPDRGATYLGGVNYSSAGRTQRGIPGLGGRPFTNTSTGRSTSGGNMWVTAYIHDFEALEEQLLGHGGIADGNSAPWRTANAVTAAKPNPSFAQSVASLRAQAANEDHAQQLEAEAYLKRAHEKLNEGKPGVAKIYFQMAQRHGAELVKEQASVGLKAIEQNKAARTVAKQ
jgi:hypothetical protein